MTNASASGHCGSILSMLADQGLGVVRRADRDLSLPRQGPYRGRLGAHALPWRSCGTCRRLSEPIFRCGILLHDGDRVEPVAPRLFAMPVKGAFGVAEQLGQISGPANLAGSRRGVARLVCLSAVHLRRKPFLHRIEEHRETSRSMRSLRIFRGGLTLSSIESTHFRRRDARGSRGRRRRWRYLREDREPVIGLHDRGILRSVEERAG